VSGSQQVLGSGSDRTGGVAGRDLHVAALKELEETLGVLLLLFGRLGEHACDLLVTLLFRLAGEEYVTAARLTFAGKRLQQILLGPCTFNALFHNLILFSVCRLFPYSKDRKIPDNSPNYLHRLFLYGYSDYL